MHYTETASPAPRRTRGRRAGLWAALVGLIVVAQSLLVALTLSVEGSRMQEQADAAAIAAAAEVKQRFTHDQQSLQALLWGDPGQDRWQAAAAAVLHERRVLLRIERRSAQMQLLQAADSPYQPPLFSQLARQDIELDTQLACGSARRRAEPTVSRSYFVPMPNGRGLEMIDLCMPSMNAGRVDGFLTASFALARMLDEVLAVGAARNHELWFVEADGTRLARAGTQRGSGAYMAERVVDLPGLSLQLRVDSLSGKPQLMPNLLVALVLGLSLALGVVVVLLVRDVRRRAGVEAALAEALAFRKAMEDSLVTGLRARDPGGRITYVNPAFCEMTGFGAAELIGQSVPPYWPPEMVDEYQRRHRARLAGGLSAAASREGFETIFMRRSGERFAVLIFEAPLVDGSGRNAGWMSAVLDVSAQRRVEELSRQQLERLQATARLATMGEMASLLSHELNQPLAAIASYAAGSLNLLDQHDQVAGMDADAVQMLHQAAQRIAEQAERAGKVIKSVHDFVRRREQARENLRADTLIEAVLPLVRLQARKSGTRVEIDMPDPAPRVVGDRTMLEQVLLNLTRNGIQAMEAQTEPSLRVLRIGVQCSHPRWVNFEISDQGPGIAPVVAGRLFTPFFTTRAEGMGLGLSLCRTVIEQHGGALDFENLAPPGGAVFRFTLPGADNEGSAASKAEARPLHAIP